jgi:glycosyltransferase involved in cell wall biosynthesis
MNAVPHTLPRVLHLFSNAKWTGPAEPALNLCVALRALGVEADFACAPDAGQSINKVVETARDRGIDPILDFHLNKHAHPLYNFLDRRALRRFLCGQPYNLIHCHLDNDHAIAAKPAAQLGLPIVRSSYEGLGFPEDARHRNLLKNTNFLIEPSMRALEQDAQAFGFPRDRMRVVPGAVNTDRFDPRRETPDGRRWLNLPADALAVGIVARMQTHRHYDDLLEAFRRLTGTVPQAHLIVVGRGTKQEQVALEPVRRLGLSERVHFTGFIDGENYVGMLRAFDIGVFLTPGSDGTCRAAREILAMGRPMVVADRGMLAEIVTHGESGLVCDGSPEALFQALETLAKDRVRRLEMGRTARRLADERYSLAQQARAVLAIYEEILHNHCSQPD